MIIGSGITIGSGISIIGISSIVTNGLTLHLDGSVYPGSGSTWADQSGNANDATLINSPTYSSLNGGYFTFNGSTQRATVAGTPLTTTTYTKSIWFYLNATADNNLISSDTGGHYMFFGGSNKLYSGHTAWTGFPNTYGSTATFVNSTWYFVTLTFNTTDGMSLYINGTLDSTYTAQKTAATSGVVNLASYGTGNLLNGRIGKVLCYNRSITSTEVLQNYNATKSNYGL